MKFAEESAINVFLPRFRKFEQWREGSNQIVPHGMGGYRKVEPCEAEKGKQADMRVHPKTDAMKAPTNRYTKDRFSHSPRMVVVRDVP